MKPDKYDHSIKKFRNVSARIDELNKLLHTYPTQKLKKRRFEGYWRFFVVRKDIMRSSVGERLQKILDVCNSWTFGDKKNPKSFCRYSWRNYYNFWGIDEMDEQYLKFLNQKEWDAANFPKGCEKFFRVHVETVNYGTKNVEVKKYYPDIPLWMLEFKYKAAYYEEEDVLPNELIGELNVLREFMHKNNGWEQLNGRHSDEWSACSTKKKIKERIHKKEMKDELYFTQ